PPLRPPSPYTTLFRSSRQYLMDQTRVLSHRQHRFVDVAALARGLHAGERLGAVPPQGPLPPGPAIDEAIAARARHRAWPDDACRDRKSTRLNSSHRTI